MVNPIVQIDAWSCWVAFAVAFSKYLEVETSTVIVKLWESSMLLPKFPWLTSNSFKNYSSYVAVAINFHCFVQWVSVQDNGCGFQEQREKDVLPNPFRFDQYTKCLSVLAFIYLDTPIQNLWRDR